MQQVLKVIRRCATLICKVHEMWLMCTRVISALRGLLAAKAWKVKGRSGGLGVLDAFAKAASSLCRALAGNLVYAFLLISIRRWSRPFAGSAALSGCNVSWVTKHDCSANAGSQSACQDSSLAQNVLGFASEVQQAALVGRPASAVPSFSLLAWANARALAHQIGFLAAPETLGLLLQIVLALPPPRMVC